MKQIMAVMNFDDAHNVTTELSRAGYSSTCIDSRGGFLGKPNVTVFVIVDDMRVRDVLKIIEEQSKGREFDMRGREMPGKYSNPSKVRVGTMVLVSDVDQFYKL